MGLGQYNSLGEYCGPHTASSVFLILRFQEKSLQYQCATSLQWGHLGVGLGSRPVDCEMSMMVLFDFFCYYLRLLKVTPDLPEVQKFKKENISS